MVERYNVDVEKNENGYWEGVLLVSANGAWVSYSDCADLERQIAELRAEYLNASKDAMELAGKLNAAEAENARLRALPLKDEMERVVDDAQTWISENVRPDDAVGNEVLCEIRALLSRLRAGEQEGKAPGAEEAFAALDVADRLIERAYGTQTPQEWHDEYHNVAKARSLSEGGSRNG